MPYLFLLSVRRSVHLPICLYLSLCVCAYTKRRLSEMSTDGAGCVEDGIWHNCRSMNDLFSIQELLLPTKWQSLAARCTAILGTVTGQFGGQEGLLGDHLGRELFFWGLLWQQSLATLTIRNMDNNEWWCLDPASLCLHNPLSSLLSCFPSIAVSTWCGRSS